jgi:hypothetical protein
MNRAPGTPRAVRRTNLLVTALLVLWIFFTVLMTWGHGFFDYTGIDYRSFYTSAQIAATAGFAQVYDLNLQEQFQRPIFETYSRIPLAYYATVPTPFLPVFVAAFLPIQVVPPVASLAAWSLLNLVVAGWYFRRLLCAAGAEPTRGTLVWFIVACPVVLTLLAGQVNTWLFICLGEFMLALMSGRELRSGLWLSGLLLKPQMLVIIVPGLLLARRFSALASFTFASAILVGVSFLLARAEGMTAMVNLVALYPGEVATNFPDSMMNWRALAVHLAPLIGREPAFVLAIVGSVITGLVALTLWLRVPRARAEAWPIVVLGSCAATGVVAWHSHVHAGFPLLAPIAYLVGSGQVSLRLFNAWVLGPTALFLVVALSLTDKLGHNAVGLGMLIVNLCILAWALKQRDKQSDKQRS